MADIQTGRLSDLQDRALLELLAGHGPLTCREIVLTVGWKVCPSLVRLEREGAIEWVPGDGYRIREEREQ